MNREYTEWLCEIRTCLQRVEDVMLNERNVPKARSEAEKASHACIFLLGTLVQDSGGSLATRYWNAPEGSWKVVAEEDAQKTPA